MHNRWNKVVNSGVVSSPFQSTIAAEQGDGRNGYHQQQEEGLQKKCHHYHHRLAKMRLQMMMIIIHLRPLLPPVSNKVVAGGGRSTASWMPAIPASRFVHRDI